MRQSRNAKASLKVLRRTGPRSQMIQLLGSRVEASFDIAQTFAPSQLSKNQTHELLPTREVFDFVVSTVALNTTMELLWMDAIQQLRKHKLTGEHASRIAAKTCPSSSASSSRSHPSYCRMAPCTRGEYAFAA